MHAQEGKRTEAGRETEREREGRGREEEEESTNSRYRVALNSASPSCRFSIPTERAFILLSNERVTLG